MKVGLVGAENSHTELVLRYLNTEERQPGWRLTHVQTSGPERDAAVRAAEPGIEIVPHLADLADTLDAVVVCDRDGAVHPAHAQPFLRRGTPVFVDKPLATTAAGVDRILADATAGDAPVVSHSSVRFTAGWRELADACAERGTPRRLRLTGPADPDSRWGGLSFYGVHLTDPALSLFDADPAPPEVRSSADGIEAVTRVGSCTVELAFTSPDGPARFHARAEWDEVTEERELRLTPDYLTPNLDDFFAVVAGSRPPSPGARLRRPVALLEQIQANLRQKD